MIPIGELRAAAKETGLEVVPTRDGAHDHVIFVPGGDLAWIRLQKHEEDTTIQVVVGPGGHSYPNWLDIHGASSNGSTAAVTRARQNALIILKALAECKLTDEEE